MNEDFYAYMDELHKFPYYTFLSDEEKAAYDEFNKPLAKVSLGIAKKHPALWGKYACGITPYDYQWKMLDAMVTHRKTAAVTSRQIGKSWTIAMFAFWAARNNIYPRGEDGKTYIAIVSASEKQSKELLDAIMKIIRKANNHYAEMTKGTKAFQKHKFTDEMTEKPTIYKIEFAGGIIECHPPTDSLLGYTASVLIIDEADKLNTPKDIYYFYQSTAFPVVKKTQGKIILTSTPKGTPSPFKDIIRPDEERPLEGWQRLWYPWTIYEDDWQNGWETRMEYLRNGNELFFSTEYEASFKTGMYSYFHPDDIDKCVMSHLSEEYTTHEPVIIGLDFGDTHSRTVITAVTFDKEEEKPKLIWYKEFEAGFENSRLPQFMRQLRKRYNVQDVICDDCVGGKTAIELLRKEGWNLKLFNFKKSKQEYYEYTKAAFANSRIMLYNAPTVIAQLKSIESVITPMGNMQIRKSKGMNDDICDSLVMALSPFTPPKKRHTVRTANWNGRK